MLGHIAKTVEKSLSLKWKATHRQQSNKNLGEKKLSMKAKGPLPELRQMAFIETSEKVEKEGVLIYESWSSTQDHWPVSLCSDDYFL